MALAFGNLESQTERLLLLTHLIRFLRRTARLLEHQVLHLQVLGHEEVLEAQYLRCHAVIALLLYQFLHVVDGLAVTHFIRLQHFLAIVYNRKTSHYLHTDLYTYYTN